MTSKEIFPISIDDFDRKIKIHKNELTKDYKIEFEPYINLATKFSIGPFFWFVPDNYKLIIVEASENIGQMTPWNQSEWENQSSQFLANLIHPDDRFYVLSAIRMMIEIVEKLNEERRQDIQFNIYGRMLDAQQKFRWILLQFPIILFTNDNKAQTALALVTDISHLNLDILPMMTFIDNKNKKHQFFKVLVESKQIIDLGLPSISKRELEIVKLMAKGLNTPQIAENLFLSYHTVENHKRNLRQKTNTKTSSELIDFVWRNNLL